MSIHEALVKIQSELKSPKSQTNKSFGYTYRSCEDILEALKPLMADQNAFLTLTDEIVEIAGRVYVKAIATFSDGDQSVSVAAFARESLEKRGMDDAQITGAASSYARKYALNGLFCIDDTEDSDATNGQEQKASPAARPAPVKAAAPKPAAPVVKKQPTATKVMEMLTACTAEKAAHLIYEQAKKYQWTPEERASIDECVKNVLAKLKPADSAMAEAERSGMKAA